MIWHFFNSRSYHIAANLINRIVHNCDYMKTDPNDNRFVIYNAKKKHLTHYKSLKNCITELCWCDNLFMLSGVLRNIKRNDIIILHSFSHKAFYLLLPLFCARMFRRTILICWGGETYLEKGIRGKLKKFIKGLLFNKFYCVMSLDGSDAKKLRENYGLENVITCPYNISSIHENICTDNEISERYLSNSKVTRIMVGNNGSTANRHIECLKKLEKYKDQNIEIICPFGYSNVDTGYIDEVKNYGERVFESKFIMIKRFLPEEEYVELLKLADIFIIHCEGQRALFNIYAFLFQGKKIYIPSDSELKSWFIELGAKTYDIESIANESYEEFSKKMDYNTAISNIMNAKKILSNKHINKVWSEIYADLRLHLV